MDDLPPGLMEMALRRVHLGDEGRLSRVYQSLSPRSRHFFQPFTHTDEEAMREWCAARWRRRT